MKYPKLSNACTERGASMGRQNSVMEPDQEIKFHLYKMPMSACGCYDNGGAYWGAGSDKHGWMWHARGEGPNYWNEVFVRATTRDGAKATVRSHFPKAKFYR